jgi:transposase
MPQRFVFVFTPTHGSWLNLIESQFSKMTRTAMDPIFWTNIFLFLDGGRH